MANQTDIQTIVDRVLAALQTNSMSIGQLSEVTTPAEGDYIELSGGKKVSVESLRKAIADYVEDGMSGHFDHISDKITAGDNALGTRIDTLKSTIETALDTQETDLTRKITAAAPQTIDFEALDTMGTDGTYAAMRLWQMQHINNPHTRFAVTTRGIIVGTLDVFSDFNGCGLTQVFESNYNFEDGALAGSHQDGTRQRYWREYGFQNRDGALVKGEWTKWRECEPASLNEAVLALKDDIADCASAAQTAGNRASAHWFGGIVYDVTVETAGTESYDKIVYCPGKGFLAHKKPVSTGGMDALGGGTYYNAWPGSDKLGTPGTDGVTPYEGTTYIDSTTGKLYIALGLAGSVGLHELPLTFSTGVIDRQYLQLSLPHFHSIINPAADDTQYEIVQCGDEPMTWPALDTAVDGAYEYPVQTAERCIVFNGKAWRFELLVVDGDKKYLHTRWQGCQQWGVFGGDGIVPMFDRLYYNISTGQLHRRWLNPDGSSNFTAINGATAATASETE